MSECPYYLLHRYTEESARAKLARHRKRGDLSVSAVSCGDHWHVVAPIGPADSPDRDPDGGSPL